MPIKQVSLPLRAIPPAALTAEVVRLLPLPVLLAIPPLVLLATPLPLPLEGRAMPRLLLLLLLLLLAIPPLDLVFGDDATLP
jgi:hypothetical protein